ncbi:MAG: ATP-dependent Clp protease ATP-binding subunit, partial [Deltaproteobacteria bacterium]|nr:ATP-dependent Clp protease ATP-binding subunit [Deltaproteobacteria bacterium]
PPETVEIIYRKATEISQHIGSSQITSLHMLMAVSRIASSSACRVLEKVGIPPANLRTMSLNALMNPKPNSITKMNAIAESTDHAVTFTGNPAVTTDIPIDDEEEDEIEEGIRRTESVEDTFAAVKEFPGEQAGRLSRFYLDPDEYPHLNSLGRNLTMQAEQGLLDPVIGREKEITLIMDILNKRRSNNPCLIGEAGVGKTAIVEGLALEIAKGDVNEGLSDRLIVSVSVSDLVAGTHLRGSFAERLSGLKEEVRRASGKVLIFIDEIHTLIGAGTGDGALDAAQDLKASLARGEFPCIGATTPKEYRKYIESDSALERRFQPVIVNEPNRDETISIIKGLLEYYSDFHGVEYSEDAINAAVNLSTRYITDRCQPDKAITLIDSAGGRVKREKRGLVGAEDVAHVVSMMTDIPLERLILRDSEHLLKMEDFFSKRIIGQKQCVRKICEVIRRNHAGFRDKRPLGSFLFIGAPGSGKTETVRVLADFLFGSREAVLRINMSEYTEKHSISRLIGPPPGYVGFEEGGLLSDSLFKRPYQIVLFSEIEHANQDVLNILLQIFDEGRITDSKGKKIDFRNTIIVLTTGIGQAILLEHKTKGIGFDFVQAAGDGDEKAREAIEKRVVAETAGRISSELMNRIEE